MISIQEAIARVLEAIEPPALEQVDLGKAAGRCLAEDVRAPADVPAFANSQMDGFALRADDLGAAGPGRAVTLRVTGVAAAGHPFVGTVEPGTAVRIMTGAPLPDGANAVVPVEEASVEAGILTILRPWPAGRFVRPAGEDLKAGEVVLRRGTCLRPADIGLLASIGLERPCVARRPTVGILGTGDEIVPVGQPLALGQVHDSNAYALAAAVEGAGGVAVRLGIVPDDRSALRRALTDALRYDVVLSTGGVSMGDHDYVKEVMSDVGLEQRFWRVAQKPGKPVTFAVKRRCLYFGLPGNPVSAMICFLLYVGPALRRAMGARAVFPPSTSVTMDEDVPTARDLTELVRCTLTRKADGLGARSTGTQSSGALRSVLLAQGLVISPPGTDLLARGSRATALLLDAAAAPAEQHPFV